MKGRPKNHFVKEVYFNQIYNVINRLFVFCIKFNEVRPIHVIIYIYITSVRTSKILYIVVIIGNLFKFYKVKVKYHFCNE